MWPNEDGGTINCGTAFDDIISLQFPEYVTGVKITEIYTVIIATCNHIWYSTTIFYLIQIESCELSILWVSDYRMLRGDGQDDAEVRGTEAAVTKMDVIKDDQIKQKLGIVEQFR